jgi:protein involved in polysaccharide export with SLBB domain
VRTAIKPLRRRKHTVFISELADEFATKTFRIDGSGDVTLPFAGRIRAAGLTADGLAQQVNAHLMKIIKELEAVVGIAEFHSQSVSVLERDTLTLPAMPFDS